MICTNVGIAGFGQSGCLIGEGQMIMFIEDKADIAGRVGSFDRRVMELGYSCCFSTIRRNSVLEEFRVRRLAVAYMFNIGNAYLYFSVAQTCG